VSRARLAIAAVVVALVGLHLFLSRSMDGFLLADGTGYLANARWLVGKAGSTWQGPAAFYNVGWSIVVAPIYLFTRSPGAVHTFVLLMNAALASLSFAAYWAVAERVAALPRRTAIAAGLVAATYPAVLLQASFEWSESLFHLLFPLLVLALHRLVTRGSTAAAVTTGALAAALYATHPKGLGAVAAVGVALGVFAWRATVPRRSALIGLGTLVVAFALTRVLHGALQHALYDKSAAGIEGDVLGRLTDPTLVLGAFRRLWGQLWYLTVASVGLVPLGVLTIARRRDRAFSLVVLGTTLAMLAASCVEMSDGTRVDHMVYGRYDEGFLPALLVFGIAGLVVHRARIFRFAAVGAALSVVLAAIAFALNGPLRTHGNVMPLNVVGVLVYRTHVDRIDVVVVTVLALLPLGALALATQRRGATVGAAVLVAFFVASSASVEARTLRPWEDFWSSVTEIPEAIHSAGIDGPVGYDAAAGYDVDAIDLYQLELTDTRGLVRDLHRPLTIEPVTEAASRTHRIVFAETGPHHLALWANGAAIARLERRGFVLPVQTSAALPDSARRARLRMSGDHVRVSHIGAGAPWLPVGPLPGVVNGTVRLGARWYDGNGTEVASQTAELPRMLLPGDSVDVPLRLRADLTPGTYRVVVALRQEGVAWWDDSAATVRIRIR
jgi:hypothetical protein